MTGREAIEFAAELAAEDRDPAATVEADVLRELWRVASMASKRRLLSELCAKAEAFRRQDVPGAVVWYPYHLERAARCAEMLGEKS